MRNVWLKLIIWIICTLILGYIISSLGAFLGWLTGIALGCNDDQLLVCSKGILFGSLAGVILTTVSSIQLWRITNSNTSSIE